jgi:hypothetical protein
MKQSAIQKGAAISNQVAQINRSRREPSYEPFVSYDPKTGVSLYKMPKVQSAPSEEQQLRKKGDSIDLYRDQKELEEDELLDDLEDEQDEDYEEDEEEEEEEEEEDGDDEDFIVDDEEELEYDEDGVEDELDEAERILALKKKAKLEPFKRVVTYYRRKEDGKLEVVPAAETAKVEPEKSNVEEEKKPVEETTNAQQ